MELIRNHWHLYEWLKQEYMWTGTVPDTNEARAEFPELSLEELGEGYYEFVLTVARFPKEGVKEHVASHC